MHGDRGLGWRRESRRGGGLMSARALMKARAVSDAVKGRWKRECAGNRDRIR